MADCEALGGGSVLPCVKHFFSTRFYEGREVACTEYGSYADICVDMQRLDMAFRAMDIFLCKTIENPTLAEQCIQTLTRVQESSGSDISL